MEQAVNGEYRMPLKEAYTEHKRLVKVLLSKSHDDDIREAKDQGEELEKMKKSLFGKKG